PTLNFFYAPPNVLGHGSLSGTSSFTTPSESPTPNALQVLSIIQQGNVTNLAGKPTNLVGNGLTWEEIGESTISTGGNGRVTSFRALGAFPVAGPVAFEFRNPVGGALVNQNRVVFSWAEFPNADTSGSNGSGAVGEVGVFAGVVSSGSSFDVPFLSSPPPDDTVWLAFMSPISMFTFNLQTDGLTTQVVA